MRRQVALACLELLAEGKVDLGPVEVAQRSGVSRATIHRWWPTTADLLRDALTEHTAHLDPPDTGSWAGDVRALAAQLHEFFADPVEVGLNVVMASGQHAEYEHAVLEHYRPLFDAWRGIVERARARGELRDGVDGDVALLALGSPLVLLPLLLHQPPSAVQVTHLADLVITATSEN